MSFLSHYHMTELFNKPVSCPSQGRFGVRDTHIVILYTDHLFIQDITGLPRAPGTHLHLCCPTCYFLGPVARTACLPSWLNIYEQSNEDKITINAIENQQMGCAARRL